MEYLERRRPLIAGCGYVGHLQLRRSGGSSDNQQLPRDRRCPDGTDEDETNLPAEFERSTTNIRGLRTHRQQNAWPRPKPTPGSEEGGCKNRKNG